MLKCLQIAYRALTVGGASFASHRPNRKQVALLWRFSGVPLFSIDEAVVLRVIRIFFNF
jgi:hypothetical protein